MIDSIESEYAKKVPILNTNQLKIVEPRIKSATIKGPWNTYRGLFSEVYL